MVYLDTVQAEGYAVYFDLQAIERCGPGFRLTGTVGDGRYEGEVLIELGSRDEVTFVDEWLAASGYREFLQRCDAVMLAEGLKETARSLRMFHHLDGRTPQPHPYAVPEDHGTGRVAEGAAA